MQAVCQRPIRRVGGRLPWVLEVTQTGAPARFPQVRMRRLRAREGIRRMVRETRLSPDRLILPLFAIEGRDASVPIPALPGHARLSPDLAARTAARAHAAGVPAVLVPGAEPNVQYELVELASEFMSRLGIR